jgi:methionyl-tRNA formyltransferase
VVLSNVMRILYMGTSAFAVPTLLALADSSHTLVAVVTRQDKPAGRGLHARQSPVKRIAESLSVPLLQPERVSHPESVRILEELRYDLAVVVAYGQILSPAVLRIPTRGNINIHASLLPKYRGAAPIQRAIMAGEKVTGVTAMWISAGLDEGDIISQRSTPIGIDETYGELHDRLADDAARLLLDTLLEIDQGTAPRLPQDSAFATFAPPLKPDEAHIVWESSADEVRNLIRSLHPKPGAYCFWRGKRLKVWNAKKIPELEGIPGRIVENSRAGPVVATRKGSLALIEIQLEGRNRISGDEFIRGYRPCMNEDLQ